MRSYDQPDSEDRYPKFTIHTASRLTGLKPGTLRAWERRYGLPSPYRTPNGHRLYAEYDLRLVRWLSDQTSAGMTIGRAVDFFHHLQSRGQDPLAGGPPRDAHPFGAGPALGGRSQDDRT